MTLNSTLLIVRVWSLWVMKEDRRYTSFEMDVVVARGHEGFDFGDREAAMGQGCEFDLCERFFHGGFSEV